MINLTELYIDEEFEKLLPKPSAEELYELEKSILQYGLTDPIKLWQDPETDKYIIIDGHNRYKIIKKHNLAWDQWNDYKIIYQLETRDDVKRWMLQQQLGRRNLPPIQRIAIAEKYRILFEKEAKENQRKATGGDRRSEEYKKNHGVTNSSQEIKQKSKAERNPTVRKQLSQVANVSEDTYRKGYIIMNSDNEQVKQKVQSGEMSINAGFKKITQDKEEQVEKKSNDQKENIVTPKQQIEKVDKRLKEIDKEILALKAEHETLKLKRSRLIEAFGFTDAELNIEKLL